MGHDKERRKRSRRVQSIALCEILGLPYRAITAPPRHPGGKERRSRPRRCKHRQTAEHNVAACAHLEYVTRTATKLRQRLEAGLRILDDVGRTTTRSIVPSDSLVV